jgi:DNA invertase Pin-like site-specific DNA recombinase
LALVYVRQSTLQQLTRNPESTRLQYALRDRAMALGWEPSRIVVIDDDLGRSGSSTAGRPGFQRLVAEVGLDHVGVILGVEMSRFARSCRDWHQLIEVCALFGTLIADLDGVYDPANHNDRLLLGLKGTISEAELHLLKRRMLDGRTAKAQRGELVVRVPIGYVRRPSGEVVKDPDEQAQALVETVFEQFIRLGRVHGVLRYLKGHGLQIPVRERFGPQTGELVWSRPSHTTLANMIKHPMYAGAYVYGRRKWDRRRAKPDGPGTGVRLLAQEDWQVLLPDRFPSYITWEQYLRNQEQLRANRSTNLGVARQGEALLPGLIRCGRCGLRMRAQYSGTYYDYLCNQGARTWLEPFCQSLSGAPLDRTIEDQVLEALKPAALEVSLAVAADVEARRAREEAEWTHRLERAQFEAERAYRQYNAVEPENRLVVRTLERHWEETLQTLRQTEEAYRRHRARVSPGLTLAEREAIGMLAADLPGLWHAATTTWAQRKEIVRLLIDQVVVTVLGNSERVHVAIHWAGGHVTRGEIVRPVRSMDQLSYLKELLDRVQGLRAEGRTAKEIAQQLNEEQWRPTKRDKTFTALMVYQLLCRRGLTRKRRKRLSLSQELAPNEWTTEALARELAVGTTTLCHWVRKGKVTARRAKGKDNRWIIHATPEDIQRWLEQKGQRAGFPSPGEPSEANQGGLDAL